MHPIRFIEMLVISHPIFISFISPFFSEEAVFFVAILSGKGLISLPVLAIFSFISIMMLDTLSFLIGRTKLVERLGRIRLLSGVYDKAKNMKIGRGIVPMIFASKFIYGTRVATIVFLGIRKYDARKFFIYNSTAVLTWILIMLPIGWLAGRGFTELIKWAKGIESFLSFALITVLVVYIGNKVFRKIIESKLGRKFSSQNQL